MDTAVVIAMDYEVGVIKNKQTRGEKNRTTVEINEKKNKNNNNNENKLKCRKQNNA